MMKDAWIWLLVLATFCNGVEMIGKGTSSNPYQVPQSLDTLLTQMSKNNSWMYTYATGLTRNIVPKFLHSHNDYWRDIPFYSALSVGAVSIEADVWLYNGTLYVGHEESALTTTRTFDGLYVQPLLKELNRMNPNTPFVTAPTRNGLFDMDSSQTMYLFIDIKTDGPTTFAAAIKALQPLRSSNYLTKFDGKTVTPGPITVIGTGNTPLNQVQGVSPRDYFFDANLAMLNSTQSNITSTVSPIASVDFASVFGEVRNGTFSSAQHAILNAQIQYAKSKNIGARYWDTPGFPLSTRNRIWTQLWSSGVMLVNVDDLVAGAGYADLSNYWVG